MSTRILETTNITLPLFLTMRNKNLAGAITLITACVLYSLANHYPVFVPQQLPMSWIDQAVPFMPETIWIYISEYVFFFAVWFTCRDMENLNKYLYSFFSLWFVSVMIFTLWPTTYPRDLFPLTSDMNPLSHLAFTILRKADAPTNCCPSLHVSSVFLSSFIFLDEQKKKFPFFFCWAAAVAVSTLTTKQHYFVDVVVGFIMAVAVYWIFHRLVGYRSVVPPDQANL